MIAADIVWFRLELGLDTRHPPALEDDRTLSPRRSTTLPIARMRAALSNFILVEFDLE